MNSIRTRLFLLLTGATALVWLLAAGWIWVSTQRELGRALDARLVEAGRMVSSLVAGQSIGGEGALSVPALPEGSYGRQLSCQIWSLDGRLLGRSSGAPSVALADRGEGISETLVDGERWRVYAIDDPVRQVRILVGDNVRVRERLVRDMILGLAVPVALILPLLAGLIWLCVGRGLAPLSRLASVLGQRRADDVAPIPIDLGTREIRPVADALDGLLARVADARERERQFTSFAAHELRTPLAGLRTQAQVALSARDEAMRDRALRQILVSVDRTSRLVRQLLDLSQLEAEGEAARPEVIDLRAMFALLEQEFTPGGRARDVALRAGGGLQEVHVRMPERLLFTALRNLVENAVQHSRSGGEVLVRCDTSGGSLVIAVDDEGPGIPADEIDVVTRRFFRGRHRRGTGTGLGLSIAELALRRCGAELQLANRPRGGLRAGIVVPATAIHRAAPATVTAAHERGRCS
ncbi:two-component sensor histidine kinase [Roseomonas sp. KE2513]|uniref:ATP-binding protein n=1 Tax=Roseomonas sp. KE2513 TaxID=2479202 RepID=UPI0018DF9BB0|nr:ATP-binding protein [Roseomonas sp. KE2513]MBI0537009.1 two-component sensor histidine kinase [Roseomonas sp. KE2513]